MPGDKNTYGALDRYAIEDRNAPEFIPLLFQKMMPQLSAHALDMQMICRILEEFAFSFGKLSYPFNIGASFLSGVMPCLYYAKNTIPQETIGKIIAGKIILANGATEPTAGSDVFNMQSTATPTEHGYLLNGRKVFITNAGIATHSLLYVKDSNTHRIELFLVDLKQDGISVSASFNKTGLVDSSLGEITFTGITCTENDRISQTKSGREIFAESMCWERMGLSAVHLGVIEYILLSCKEIAEKNNTHDQSTWQRMAKIGARLKTLKSFLYDAEPHTDVMAKASMCKLLSSELFIDTANMLPGWIGAEHLSDSYMREFILDAPATSIYSGTNEIQHEIIAAFFRIKNDRGR